MAVGKILCLGDSLTAGLEQSSSGYRSYRGALQKLLLDAGYAVNFVGTQSSTPASGGTDPDHDGYGGARMDSSDDAANSIEGRIASIQAAVGAVDIIILLIGWNDVYEATANIATKHADLLATIQAGTWASAKIVMVTLSPEPNKTAAQTGSDYPLYTTLNDAIRGAVTGTRIVADLAALTAGANADRDAMVEKLLYDAGTFPTVTQDATGRSLPSVLGGHYISSFKSIQDWCALWRTSVPQRRGMNGGSTQLAPDPSHVGHPYFVNSVNAIVPWLWVFAGPGHASSNTVVEARNMFAQAQRGSNGQWEFFFEGARPGATDANSAIYDNNGFALRGFRDGETSYYRTSGGTNIEAWPGDTVPSRGVEQFAGGRNRSLMADAVSFCVGVQVRLALLNPAGSNDVAQSRFVVACGYDAYAGAPYRYDYWGWPYEAMDGGHDRWQVLTATDWTWIGSIPMDRGSGHYEDPGTPPPHVFDYTGGAYPYNDYPVYSKSASEIRANPPRLPQYFSGAGSSGSASAWVPTDYWYNSTLGGLDIHWSQQGADRAARPIFSAMLQAGWLDSFAAGSGGEPIVVSPLPGVGSIGSWLARFSDETTDPDTAAWRGLDESVTTVAPIWGEATSAPIATLASAYSGQLTAAGTPTPTFSIVSGAPSWLACSSGGALSGTPDGVPASHSIVFRATNSAGTADKTLLLEVVAGLSITTPALKTLTEGVASIDQLTASGRSPIVFAVSNGSSLPSGVTLSTSGLLTYGATVAAGGYTFGITATNGISPATSRTYTLTVAAAPTPPELPGRWTRIPRDTEVWIRVPRDDA